MLFSIGLQNFKAFGDDTQTAPLSKINFIFGPNSGGKSSIIQALLLLKQSRSDDVFSMLRAGQPTGRLRPRGEYVDLGGFNALIHKHDTGRMLGISLSFSGFGLTDTGMEEGQRITTGMSFASEMPQISTDFMGLTYRVEEGGEILLDGEWRYNVDHHSEATMSSSFSILGTDVPPDLIGISHTNFLPYLYVPGLMPEGAVDWAESSSNPKVVAFREALVSASGPEIERRLRLVGTYHSYDNLLNSIVYLGPLRSSPERLYPISRMNRTNTGVRGEFAPEVLYSNSEFVDLANYWFNRFDVPYTLVVDFFGSFEVTGEFVSMSLIDKRTNTKVTLADVGFGINQLLPVIVEGIIPPTAWSPLDRMHSIVCVEQPEIHLHPRLQAEIADLMIDTSRGDRGKQWIVETHSELLMRRLQRRVAEGVIEPSDISVLYVDPVGFDGTEIYVLRLDDDGQFIDDWPNGFFEEGFNELMGY